MTPSRHLPPPDDPNFAIEPMDPDKFLDSDDSNRSDEDLLRSGAWGPPEDEGEGDGEGDDD